MAKDWQISKPPVARSTSMVLADGAAQEQSRVWPVLRAVLWVFVLSRVFFFEVASLAYIYLPHAWVEAPEGTLPPPGGLLYHVLAGLWVHWDGLWYLSIARYGYVNRPTATAFFPLYPFAMHVLGDSTVVGGIVISLVAYAVALYFLAKLVTMECGPRVAWMTLLALAFFPTAFYNNAVYSESLFLMFALGSLYFLRTRRYGWGGLFGALATLVSVYGLFLAVPYAWQIWRQEGLRWRKLLHVLWMPAGLMAYMAYLTPLFGDPLIFQKAQSNWGRHFEPLVVTLWQGWHAALKAAPLVVRPAILFAQGQPSSLPANFFNFVFALFALVVAIGSVRRLPFYLWAYMACALLLPLSYPAQGQPLMSMPRLLLEAFPLFIGLGDMMARTRWVRATYFVLAIPLGMLLVSLFATAHWVA